MMDLLGISFFLRKDPASKDPDMESLEHAQSNHQLKNRERRYIAIGLGLPIVLAFFIFMVSVGIVILLSQKWWFVSRKSQQRQA